MSIKHISCNVFALGELCQIYGRINKIMSAITTVKISGS